ncbi:MAG: hypothetical protein WCN64_11535 [Planctomycetota bacterium]
MFLPNTTCDYFKDGHLPETDPPDLAAVPIFLDGDFMRGNLGIDKLRWTHLLKVRGNGEILAGDLATNLVYVPNKDGTCFEIVFVEVLERGKAASFKRVYLERKSITWPSEQL